MWDLDLKRVPTDQVGVFPQIIFCEACTYYERTMSADYEESIEDKVLQLISQPLHPDLFKPAGDVTQGHVLSSFGNVTVGLHKEVIDGLLEKVKDIKADVQQWGLHQVQAQIYTNFNR